MGAIIDLARHVTNELAGASLPLSAEVGLDYHPTIDVTDNRLLVSVVPREVRDQSESRDRRSLYITLEIVIRKKLTDDVQVGIMIDYVEALISELEEMGLPSGYLGLSVAASPLYFHEYLDTHRLFVSTVSCEYVYSV
jgi:hypothetical protein